MIIITYRNVLNSIALGWVFIFILKELNTELSQPKPKLWLQTHLSSIGLKITIKANIQSKILYKFQFQSQKNF